ncbi:MAG: EamA family transporter, partial [Candidatus Eremiobacteraeota bacterium]|nr:EamA family transporter [Candidatus Eremiobacteraeota bacterium]
LAIPVVGIVSAYLQLGERPQPIQWLGIVTILAALVLVTTANVPRLRLAFARLRSG